MPRGRPKGSKRTATAAQLSALTKARKVRAKQIKYFPALPQGGFKALTTPARVSARTAAYNKFSKKMLSGANKMMPSIVYGSIRTAYPVSYSGKPIKPRKSRVSKSNTSVDAAVNQVVAAAKKVKRVATEKQLAALKKAREARITKRGAYVALPKGGYRALNTVARRNAKEAAYAAMGNALVLRGNNSQLALYPYGTRNEMGRFVPSR